MPLLASPPAGVEMVLRGCTHQHRTGDLPSNPLQGVRAGRDEEVIGRGHAEAHSPCSMYQRSPVSRSIAAWTAALKASEFSILSLWLAPSRPLRGCPALLRDAAARIRIEAADESEDLGMVLIPSSVELGDLLADRRVRVVGEIEGDEVGHERQADRVRL